MRKSIPILCLIIFSTCLVIKPVLVDTQKSFTEEAFNSSDPIKNFSYPFPLTWLSEELLGDTNPSEHDEPIWDGSDNVDNNVYRDEDKQYKFYVQQVTSYCLKIDTPGVHYLTDDILECNETVGIYITSSDVILDGNSHIVDGNSSSALYGVFIEGNLKNVTIKNLIIKEWKLAGIFVDLGSYNITLCSNTIRDVDYDGIYLSDDVNNCKIYSNTLRDIDNYGIDLSNVTLCEIYSNIVRDIGDTGIRLRSGAHQCKIFSNTVRDVNGYAIALEVNSYDNDIYSNTLIYNGIGINLWSSENNTIYDNTISSNNDGLLIQFSSNNDIYSNEIYSNSDKGIEFQSSNENAIYFNTIDDNTYGIAFLVESNDNAMYSNTISNNYGGVGISSSKYNRILSNEFFGNGYSVYLESYADKNIISGNYMHEENYNAIVVSSCNDTTIRDNTIQYTGMSSIHISLVYNASIYGNHISNSNGRAIYIASSSNITIFDNTLELNSDGSVYMYNCSLVALNNNEIKENFESGIQIVLSGNITVSNNKVQENDKYGIVLTDTNDSIILNNSFIEDCIFVDNAWNNTFQNNTVNGRPLFYIENAKDLSVDGDFGQIIVVGSKNITLSGTSFYNCDIGIELYASNNCKIENTEIYGDGMIGILLMESNNSEIRNNEIKESFDTGIYLTNSHYNIIMNNTFLNQFTGTYLYQSNFNTITVNSLNLSASSSVSIYIYGCGNNTIYENEIEENSYGLIIYLAENITIYRNELNNNSVGIYMYNTENIVIYLNNFIGNDDDVSMYFSDTCRFYSLTTIQYTYMGNKFENYLGNYWSDYSGEDQNNDGIGDTPYFDDQYPLIWKVGEAIIDEQKPIIGINEPANGIVWNESSLTIKWTTSDISGIDHLELYIDGQLIDDNIPSSQTSYDLNLSEGEHTIEVIAIDKYGNSNSDQITIIVDLELPTIAIIQPIEDLITNITSINLVWQASDPNGIDHFELYVDGQVIDDNIPATQTTYTLSLNEGEHIIEIRAIDSVGKVGHSTVNVLVDITPPTVMIDNIQYFFDINTVNTTIVWKADDNVEIDHFEIYVDGELIAVVPANQTSYNISLSEGLHKIEIKAVDKAGNSKIYQVSVAPSRPDNQASILDLIPFYIWLILGIFIGVVLVVLLSIKKERKSSLTEKEPKEKMTEL